MLSVSLNPSSLQAGYSMKINFLSNKPKSAFMKRRLFYDEFGLIEFCQLKIQDSFNDS